MRQLACSPIVCCLLLATAGVGLAQDPKAPPATARPPATVNRPAAAAAAAPKAAVDPAAARKMDEILARWEELSQQIKSLDATFRRIDDSKVFEKVTKFEGRAQLQSPNLACVDFWETPEGKPKVFHERIVVTPDKVFHLVGKTRQVFIYPLAQQQQKRALEEGPLPFLFNMKVARAKQRYEFTLIEDKPKQYLIRIIPLQAIDREEFSQALILLSKDRFLPDAIQLFGPNGKDTKTYDFRQRPITRNVPIPPENLDGPGLAQKMAKLNPPWKIVENPDDEGRPQGAPRAAQAEAPPSSSGARGNAIPRRRN